MFKTHLRQVQNTWIICSATPKSGCERTSDQLRIAALKIPSTGPAAKAKPNPRVLGVQLKACFSTHAFIVLSPGE